MDYGNFDKIKKPGSSYSERLLGLLEERPLKMEDVMKKFPDTELIKRTIKIFNQNNIVDVKSPNNDGVFYVGLTKEYRCGVLHRI